MASFITGNTGTSTGAHLDLRVFNPATGQYEDPSSYTSYLTVGDNGDAFNFEVTSPRGMRTHPVHGDRRMHEGIDYATPEGTVLNVNGQHLSTWNDPGGGGVMSQYAIQTDDGTREIILMHGSGNNTITGDGALTSYDLDDLPVVARVDGGDGDNGGGTSAQQEARERAKNYKEMSKAELDSAYDAMRSDPAKAREEGMKMHKAYFGKR